MTNTTIIESAGVRATRTLRRRQDEVEGDEEIEDFGLVVSANEVGNEESKV